MTAVSTSFEKTYRSHLLFEFKTNLKWLRVGLRRRLTTLRLMSAVSTGHGSWKARKTTIITINQSVSAGQSEIMASVGILWTINVDAAGNFSSSVKPTGKGAIEAKGKLGEEVLVINGDGEEQIRVYKLDGDKMLVSGNFKNE